MPRKLRLEYPGALYHLMNRAIRRIEVLREYHGINLTGIRMIRELMQEVERLRGELRFQTGR